MFSDIWSPFLRLRKLSKKDGLKINLRFAADERKTSKRIGTVMAVFNTLAENKQNLEYHYTLALYNGKCRDSIFMALIVFCIYQLIKLFTFTSMNNNCLKWISLKV